jgi:arabinofuranosyltransferase
MRDHAFTLYDDAYIYLRYVRNLREGCGFRFNCQDAPVEGFTSPLYLALLTAGSFVTHRLVYLTQVVGAVAMIATIGAAAYAAARAAFGATDWRLRAALALGVAAVLGLDHDVLVNCVIGLEEPVAALVVTAVWIAVIADRRAAALGLVVLAVLARPEGVLLAVLLPVLPWARRPRVVVGLVAALCFVTLVRWGLFHDFVPNTYWAKAGGTTKHFALGVDYLAMLVRDEFPLIMLAPLALLVKDTRPAVTYALLMTAAWFGFFLRSGGDVFRFGRLAFPLVPLLTVLALRGIAETARLIALHLGRAAMAPSVSALAVALVSAAVAARASSHWLAPVHGDPLVMQWSALGRYLKEKRPGATVATVPIGAIGYFSRLRVIDLLGLTTPAVAKAGNTLPPELLTRGWLGHERHNTAWVLDQRPDLVITTKFRATPWATLDEAQAGFYADWLVLRAIKAGVAPYHVTDLPVTPSLHFLAFERDAEAERPIQ